MKARVRSITLRLASTLAVALVAFSLGAVSSARAGSGRAAPGATLQAILDALDALASGLRPASNGQTRLLFSLVTTTGNLSPTLFIANTGQDASGTPGHAGACTAELFDGTRHLTLSAVPAPVGGLAVVDVNSGTAPSFFGYAIVICDFPLGHGFFSIVGVGVPPVFGQASILPPSRSAAVVEALGQ